MQKLVETFRLGEKQNHKLSPDSQEEIWDLMSNDQQSTKSAVSAHQ